MQPYQLSEKHKSMLIEIIHKHLPTAKIYLFGFRARNKNSQGSDVDLAVDTEAKIDIKILWDTKDEISETTFPYFVDLVDLNSIDDNFYQVIKKDLVPWTT